MRPKQQLRRINYLLKKNPNDYKLLKQKYDIEKLNNIANCYIYKLFNNNLSS